jgi:hypothetical protein
MRIHKKIKKVLHAAAPRQQSAKLFVLYFDKRPSKAVLPKNVL